MGLFSRSLPPRDTGKLPNTTSPPPPSSDASSQTITRPRPSPGPLPNEASRPRSSLVYQHHQHYQQQQQHQQQQSEAPLPSQPLHLLSRLSSAASPSSYSSLSLPLSSPSSSQAMPRTMADFHIRPDNPYRTYTAGDHVRGSVVLAVVKPMRITHLVVALHGSVRVFRSAADGVKSKSLSAPAPIGSSGRPQYHGSGQASLFQDEQVLSGEGRLEPQRYEFQFNLKFPEKPLPSSVDFERGSIAYVITATLTRPASIKATTTCDRCIRLEERVDVGPIAAPRPRTIFLEPISKVARKKRPLATGGRALKMPDGTETGSISDRDAESPVRESLAWVGSDLNDGQSVASAGSARSTRSASTAPSSRNADGLQISPNLGLSSSALASVTQEMDDKTITATVELLRGGCLPGDLVPIKITVQHVKAIKSMHGIIVTLYREAKINPAPAASLFDGGSPTPTPDSHPARPKTRPKLSGLSRVSSSKASSFRKDLSQSVGPLLIDPVTLGTSVTVAVRVPEDSFPTMQRVPGDMINFRYRVEVIADLGGRLANQFQTAQQSSRVNTFMNSNTSNDMKVLNSWGGTVINTTSMSRERGIVVVNLEVVIGTVNSARQPLQRGKRITAARGSGQPATPEETVNVSEPPAQNVDVAMTMPMPMPMPASTPVPAPADYSIIPPAAGDPEPAQIGPQSPPTSLGPWPAYVPPPHVPDESRLTEKERIQRAEQRLLPSQPPSAPPADEAGPSAPPDLVVSESSLATRPLAPFQGQDQTQDKQEAERTRLLAEASAPLEVPEDSEDPGPGVGASADAVPGEPTAPVLDEDQYGGQYSFRPTHEHDAAEPLPRYER